MFNDDREDRLLILTEQKSYLVLGIFFSALGSALLLLVIPAQIRNSGNFPLPSTLPNAYSALLLLIGLFITAQSFRLRNKPADTEKNIVFSRNGIIKSAIALAILFLNLIGLIYASYLPVTMVTLFVLMWVFGQRNRIVLIVVSIALPLLIYYGFTTGLKLVLP
jgi:hypothetical protein